MTRVLVTGASAGIGRALAQLWAAQGATHVGLVGRRDDRLAEVQADVEAAGASCRRWAVDLGDVDAAARVAAEAWDALGGVDVLVNNAAIPKRRHVQDLTFAEVEEVMRVNFLSPVRMTLELLPRWLERGSGCVVNVASMGGRLPIAHETAYCASKFALSGWSETLAVDLHGTGVRVRLVQPGPIDTDIWDRPDNDTAHYDGPLEPPETVAQGIVDAVDSDRFEHYLPDLKAVVDAKQADVDGFIAGIAAFAKGSTAEP